MKFPKDYLINANANPKSQIVATTVEQATQAPIDLENSQETVAKLDLGMLPFAAKTYHISPRIEDYILVTTPICPANLPNRNGIAFPLSELTAYQPPPIARQAYKAWAGCPVHSEHDNEDCTKAYGIVLDAVLTKVKGYGGGNFWKVMGLAAIDKNKYPDVASKVMSGELNTYSMGALADSFTCSVCGAQAYKERHRNCSHITSIQDVNFKLTHYEGQTRLAYLNAHSLQPIELSIVADPAWTTALSDTLMEY